MQINLKNKFKISPPMWVAASGWLSRIIAALSQIITIPLVLKYLGLEAYAIFVVLTGLVFWYGLADLGLGTAIQNKVSTLRATNQDIQIFLQKITLLIILILAGECLIFIMLSPLIQKWIFSNLSQQDQVIPLITSGVLFIIYTLVSIAYRVLFSLHKGYIAYLYQILSTIISLVALYITAHVNTPYRLEWILISWQLPQVLMAMIAFIRIFSLKYFWRYWDFATYKNLLAEASKFEIFAISATIVLNIDYIVMAKVLSAENIIIYNILARVFTLVYFAYNSILLALWPIAAEMFVVCNLENIIKFNKMLRNNIIAGLLYMAFSGVAILVFRGQITAILIKSNIDIPVMTVIFMTIYWMLRAWTDPFTMVLQAGNKMRVFMYVVPIQAVISVILIYVLALKLQLLGVILGLIASFVVTVVWILPLCYYLTLKNYYPALK